MTDILEDVVAFRADSLSGPWSQPFMVAPHNTRTYNSQSGFSLKIEGSKKTTYLYLGDQVHFPIIPFLRHFTNEEVLIVGHELPVGEPIHLVANGNR